MRVDERGQCLTDVRATQDQWEVGIDMINPAQCRREMSVGASEGVTIPPASQQPDWIKRSASESITSKVLL
jgi:hypothetical protein